MLGLRLKKIATAVEKSSRGLPEMVPSMLLVSDGVVLNKNGSVTAMFDLGGVDLEGKTQTSYDATATNQEHAFGGFDDCITLDQYVDRYRTFDYPEGQFEDEISSAVDEVWKAQFTSGHQYRNRLTLALTYTPKRSAEGLIERATARAGQGESWPKAILAAIKSHLSLSAEMAFSSEEIATFVRRLEEMASSYCAAYTAGVIRRLRGAELLGSLYRRINLTHEIARVALPQAPIYLDSLLPAITVTANADVSTVLELQADKKRYLAALTIKEWPTAAFTGLLDGLLAIPGEFTIHHCFRFVSSEFADKHTSKMERHHRDLAVTFRDMVKQGITGKAPTQFDEGRMSLSQDAAAARASITSNNERFGWYHFGVLVQGETQEEVEATLSEIRKAIARFEIVAIRESMGLLSAFCGSFPGNADLLIRWFFFSSAAFANLINLRTVTSGSLHNPHYSEQRREFTPTLTAFPTQFNTPFYFSTHVDDLGHTFIVGPPGAGKSTVASFMLLQFRKYAGGNIYIFDKDHTCLIPTRLAGGQHMKLASVEARGMMNPPALLATREDDGSFTHFEWVSRFVRYLLEALSETPLSAEKKQFEELEQAVRLTAQLGQSNPQLLSLSTIATHFTSDELKSRIRPWLRGQEKGRYFDNEVDAFSLGNFNTIEMGQLLKDDPITAMAVLDYAVHRITMRLADGSTAPTVIYIEEVWYMLKNPAFESIIENWLRVLRKKNAVLWFATQSLDELASSNISSAIVNSVPTKIFLPNEEARSVQNYSLYTETFGLNDAQVAQIQGGIRKTNYLIVQGGISRMVWARFDPTILACVRSDVLAQKVFAKHWATRASNSHWKADYIEDLTTQVAA